jgi:hypothetical protein
MRWHRLSVFAAAALSLSFVGTAAFAQMPGGGGMPRTDGKTSNRRDSATIAQMAVVHELFLNHNRITRTVMKLPGGIRTITESDDPLVAQRIKDHIATMTERVIAGDDPGLPMESAAVRTLFRNKDKIRTYAHTTAKGIVLIQISSDRETVAALQQHASEVSELVRRGMPALHDAMMKSNGMMVNDASMKKDGR